MTAEQSSSCKHTCPCAYNSAPPVSAADRCLSCSGGLVAAPLPQFVKHALHCSYSLMATRAKPLAAGAVVSFGGAAPPKIWNSSVPRNSAMRQRNSSDLIWPVWVSTRLTCCLQDASRGRKEQLAGRDISSGLQESTVTRYAQDRTHQLHGNVLYIVLLHSAARTPLHLHAVLCFQHSNC